MPLLERAITMWPRRDLPIIEDDDAASAEESALVPDGYFSQATLDELRRYVCLDMARLGGAMPDKLVRAAREMERFLLGRSLRSADDHD